MVQPTRRSYDKPWRDGPETGICACQRRTKTHILLSFSLATTVRCYVYARVLAVIERMLFCFILFQILRRAKKELKIKNNTVGSVLLAVFFLELA